MPYTAVFDTNILISALLSTKSNPFRSLALAKIGKIESITCQEILDEFAEKLIVKFKFSQEMTQAAVEEVASFSRIIKISTTLKVVEADPDDDMVIECAVVGNATHIVTGDKHLLSIARHGSIEIVNATDFIALSNMT